MEDLNQFKEKTRLSFDKVMKREKMEELLSNSNSSDDSNNLEVSKEMDKHKHKDKDMERNKEQHILKTKLNNHDITKINRHKSVNTSINGSVSFKHIKLHSNVNDSLQTKESKLN